MLRQFINLASIAVLTMLFVDIVYGHSALIKPLPYKLNYDNDVYPNGCQPFKCPPCPNYLPGAKNTRNHPTLPQETWHRGERVKVGWARNNHRGGFYRLSLVPFSKIYDHDAHKQLAFHYGCWDQNRVLCTQSPCGSDHNNLTFETEVEVPAVLPDDVYVFAWAWFGGVDRTEDKPRFADFYSCSFVNISGGAELTDSYQPEFEAGPATGEPGKCLTANTEPGICTQLLQCTEGPIAYNVPSVFQNGHKPDPITKEHYVQSDIPVPASPSSSALPASPLPSQSSLPVSPTESPFANPPTESPSALPVSASPSVLGAICAGRYCCPQSCGRCGGSGCADRDGGGACCTKQIATSGRRCGEYPPPCIQKRRRRSFK